MDIESFRSFCLTLEDTTEEFPFGPDTLVYKVRGKVFALTGIEHFESINLKCDPELVTELRERYPAVQPGYHMNKKHWNTIIMDHSIPDKLIIDWIRHSYDLVVSKLPKKK
ncbi:MAG: MmcQ/YjbR family DNA-binding protein [Chitinophagaceae bacterium]|nr:MAG: MmcQ/YjbR family DNA-binding protein [Chitinophagaceae bacterium]